MYNHIFPIDEKSAVSYCLLVIDDILIHRKKGNIHKLFFFDIYLMQVELVILPRSIINETPPEQQNQQPPPPPPPQNQDSGEEEQNEEEDQEVC